LREWGWIGELSAAELGDQAVWKVSAADFL
jgi:hypothetical protein